MSALALMLLISVQQLPEPFETDWNRAIPTVIAPPAGTALGVGAWLLI